MNVTHVYVSYGMQCTITEINGLYIRHSILYKNFGKKKQILLTFLYSSPGSMKHNRSIKSFGAAIEIECVRFLPANGVWETSFTCEKMLLKVDICYQLHNY
jgi:hypothetical protein